MDIESLLSIDSISQFLKTTTGNVLRELISAAILAWITPFLKSKRQELLDRFWFVVRYLIFLSLLTFALWRNSTCFDQTEFFSLMVFLVSALSFEAFLKWQAIHQHSRIYLRILFNVAAIYVPLRLFANTFDGTEIQTVLEFLVYCLIFEFVRTRGRVEVVGNIRYEVNRRVSRSKVKRLFASEGIGYSNINKIVSRSYIHVAAYLDTGMVGFVNLIWSGHGPAEVDYFFTKRNVSDADTGLVKILETQAKSANIDEIQISNKVMKLNSYLDDRLTLLSGYHREVCLVKPLKEKQKDDMDTHQSGATTAVQ